jgi:cytochrome c peroxidase
MNVAVRELQTLLTVGSLGRLSDEQLLDRFVEQREDAVFEAIVHRHGPMVWGVCRRVLRDRHDAEDAFQATFIVLARKAASIMIREKLGHWLYGVAYKTAKKAKSMRAKRRMREVQVTEVPEPIVVSDEPRDAGAESLDRELSRLPDRYRIPVVLCGLEGRSHREAAEQLGWPIGTVSSRLSRAKLLLAKRLTRRGLSLSSGSLAVLLAQESEAAAMPARLIVSTARAASQIAAAGPVPAGLVSAEVAAMTQGVLKMMLLSKIKLATAALVLISLVVTGVSLTRLSAHAAEPTNKPNPTDGIRTKPMKPSTARTLYLPDKLDHYADIDLPAHFKTLLAERSDNTPADNPVTDHGATLGRVLFYDTRLSANDTVSCGSCHVQKNSFVDPNRFSKGFEGKMTDRHAMSLVNLRHVARGRFFWDERAGNLEETVLLPVQNKTEMGQDLTRLVEILGKDARYPELFKKAFGDDKVTQQRIGQALAQFLRSMVACHSKFDDGLAKVTSVGDDFPNFTIQENRGKALFVNNCAICHKPGQDVNFFMNRPTNNGLDEDYKNTETDGGVGDITFNGGQIGFFKSPSLRNVEHTAPYMHDGRFDTLEKVIDHYSKEFKPHPNLDPRMRRLNYTDSEKANLIAFLKTLTDKKFLTDPKFSDPFK